MSSTAFQTTLTAAPLICTGRLLDTIPRTGTPMAMAYSTRKVATAYRGPCLRVRRTSDNREQDIGFVQTDFDWQALLTFAAGFDCFVSVWYDQSGRGRHATQPDAAKQPQIVRDGKVVMDKNTNQVSIRFNGAFLNTDWNPQASEMTEGAGILASASIGLDGKSLQSGTAAITSQLPAGMTVTTEYPSPLLPEGHDLYLLEGMTVYPDGPESNANVVYTSGGYLTHLHVNAEKTGFDGASVSTELTPSGPAVLTVDTLATGKTAQNSQWRRGIKLGGRIFAIPSNADQILEIKYAAGVATPDRVVRHDLPNLLIQQKDLPNKFWMGVAVSANVGYCIPADANYVLRIDASTPTPTFRAIGVGPDKTTPLDSTGLTNKWHDGVFLNGKVWAVPHNASQMFTITPGATAAADVVAFVPGPNLTTGKQLWSAAVASGDKVVGVPWNAACFLVANTTSSAVTVEGTTGMTPFIATWPAHHGSGYIEPPTLSVVTAEGTNNGGVPLQLTAAVEKTRSVMSVTMTSEGEGYTSSPTIAWNMNNSRYGAIPQSALVGAAAPGIAATMVPADAADPTKGYKVTGIRVTNGGANIPPGVTPTITITGGKGATAKALAVVAEGKVILINVDPKNPGSGYLKPPTIEIRGGGGSGATAVVEALTPVVYTTDPVTGRITSSGGAIVSIRVVTSGAGYSTRSPPEVVIKNDGKGASNAAATPVLKTDGQVTVVTPAGGASGSGYAVESSSPVTPTIVIDPPERPGGIRARAYISEVNGTGAITKITISNPGSGYTLTQNVQVTVAQNAPGQGSGGGATATVEEDGWLSTNITIAQQGTRYTVAPTVTVTGGFGPRTPLTGDATDTPIAAAGASKAVVTVQLEGTTTTARSPYTYGGMPNGTAKFLATFVPETESNTVYCFPHWTNRILKFDSSTFACSDVYPKKTVVVNNVTQIVDDTTALGRGFAQHVAGVALRDATQEVFYCLPYERKQILKYAVGTGASILPKTYSGKYNQGILSPANKNIYCVPADANALLVIDTKQEAKSEMVYFANVRGTQRNKWWGAVLAGDTPAENLIFGIPGDIDTILELNPGVPLRRKTLPAPGVVLPDQRHILFAPAPQNDGSRALIKYDTQTQTIPAVGGIIPTGGGANVTYVEGVCLDGNVIFVPCYNQTDSFKYDGNVGVYNIATNTFAYSATQVPVDQAAPFPSRTATPLGTTLVSWVPRETDAAMITYNHAEPDPTKRLDATKGTRSQTKVDVAAAVKVGDPATSQRVLVAQPSPTQVALMAAPTYGYSWPRARFGGAALTRDNVVVLPPGGAIDHVTLFYPANPGAALGVTTTPNRTQMDVSLDVADEFATLAGATKFAGAIYNGVDDKVYCIPLAYWRVLSVDVVNGTVSTFGDLLEDFGGAGSNWYWGGCIGADGKIYCAPYNATKIMVIDPAVANPSGRISYIDLPAGVSGAGKWRGAALANDGRIFCAPYNATTVLIIDPATKTSVAVGGPTWLSNAAEPGKFCDIVVGADKNMYLMPARSPYMVGIDPASSGAGGLVVSMEPLDTKIGPHASSDRWGGACAAPNGRLYAAPAAYSEALEYDITTGVLERLGGPYSSDVNSDSYRWSAIIPGRDGNVYAFPYFWNQILKIETEQTRVHLWNRQGAPAWLTTQPMDGPYRLRPFLLSDRETAVFHTSGRSSLNLYNVANIDANTAPIVGTGVQDGIAAHFPDADDTILVANVNTLVAVTPFQGGIAGVKSYSGDADLFVGTNGPDLTAAVGNASVGIRNILNTLLEGGVPGVYGAYGNAATDNLDLYIRDVPLGGTAYAWSGESGNIFSVGTVQGTEAIAFNAPSYRRGFNGLISELVVFQSDQTGRASALGESSSFYYLQSKSTVTQ